MKNILSILIFLQSINLVSQISPNSVLQLRNITDAEMTGMVGTANEGSLIYNTDDDGIYRYNGTVWTKIDNSLQTVVLNRDSGFGGGPNDDYFFNGQDNYRDFPVDAGDIQTIDSNIFEVIGNGEIRVLEDGVYFISGAISTEGDFPDDDDIKYILGVFLNGNTANDDIIGFLTRGFVTADSNNEFWGASGVMMYQLEANDIINLRYRIDANETNINGWFTNIGITKMQ